MAWRRVSLIRILKTATEHLRAISFLKDSEKDNAYARPIQGLIAHVDLTEKKVVEIEDHGVVKVPEAPLDMIKTAKSH